ncbi:MAG: AMP-binding protein [Deltaproteobacteria bacterium]|nr:AMP-binding protein [Deltaproteobacteria bacterium]
MDLLQDVLYDTVRHYGSRTAFDSIDRETTFDQLCARIEHLAGALSRLGIGQGDRIAILSGNCTDYIAWHYASAKIGVILLVLNIRHTLNELSWVINNAEASALIIDGSYQTLLADLSASCPSLKFTIAIGDRKAADYATDELAAAGQEVVAEPRLSPQDPVLLIYTSGTTGKPKGGLQTHEGSVMIDRLTAEVLRTNPQDVYLAFMPYFHQAGLIRTRATMQGGGANLVATKFDPESLVYYLIRKNVSITMLVPPYDTLLTEIADREKLTFPSLRFVIGAGGAGPVHAQRMRAFCTKFGCSYMGVYGQTETTGPVTIITDQDYFTRPDSCGKPMEGIDLQIWDEQNRSLPGGRIGEIMIRSKTCIPGYWKNETASAALYTGDWLHTGDLGKMDEEGWLYFVDRKKELIKTGGENVYSREVEDVLRSRPAIEDLVVIGLPDIDGWGEIVTAVVILKEGKLLSLDEVKSYCRDKIAGYKIPKLLKTVQSFPRNHTGKILKRLLQEQFKQDQSVKGIQG